MAVRFFLGEKIGQNGKFEAGRTAGFCGERNKLVSFALPKC